MTARPPQPARPTGEGLIFVDIYEPQESTGQGGIGYSDAQLQHENVPGNLHKMTARRAQRYGSDHPDDLYDLYLSNATANGTAISTNLGHRFVISGVRYTPLGSPIDTGDGRSRIAIKRTRG